MFGVLGAAAIGCLGTFDPQNLGNFAWAYATVERASPQLFGALAQASLHRLDDFVAEGLSSTAWAYAKAGIPAPALFREIAKRAQAKLGSFNHQALYVTASHMFRLVRDDAIDAYLASTAWRVTPSTRIDVSNTQGQHHLGLRRGRRPRARAFRCHRRDGFNTRRALQLPGPREPGPSILEREAVLAEALRLHRRDLPDTRLGRVQLPGPREHGLRFWDRRPCVAGII